MDFINMMAELKNGMVVAQLGEDFAELVAAVRKHGRKGELTLKLRVEPARITDGVVKEVDVAYELKIVKPQPNHGQTIFFVTEDAKLSRQDPRQTEFEYERKAAN